MKGPRVVVQGFGNAGTIALYNRNGLDIPKLIMHKERTGTLKGFPAAEEITLEQLLALDCEILIPAALENVITEENAHAIRAKIIAEAANGPVTPCSSSPTSCATRAE